MEQINVGLIGYNFMGRAHSNAYRQVPFYFPEVAAKPVMKAICGRTKERVDACAEQFGWESVEYDVDDLLARDDIDLVDITVPNNMHADVAIRAIEAGKHVICEKPLATTVEDAERMVEAANKAGCVNMLCHNYRRAPAISLAKQMIENGDLGEIYHWRSLYLQDWLMSPDVPMMWRVEKEIAGSGSLGDLMAHSIDLALWLLGEPGRPGRRGRPDGHGGCRRRRRRPLPLRQRRAGDDGGHALCGRAQELQLVRGERLEGLAGV